MSRNSSTLRLTSLIVAVSFVSQILFPTTMLALTGGPSQPEVQSFEPVGTSQMVDPFTGDFTYNIPLLDVGGYPVNISYHSGITMDQEASWVGLGWNINPGVINRNLRGLPDDFNGDMLESEFNMKKNQTYSLSANMGVEIFGAEGVDEKLEFKASLGYGINYNTYEGVGVDIMAGVNMSLDIGKSGQEFGTAGLGLNFISSSNDGLNVNPTVSYSQKMGEKLNGLGLAGLNASGGMALNSRQGLKSYSLGVSGDIKKSFSGKNSYAVIDQSQGLYSSMSMMPNTYVPTQKFPFESGSYSASFKIGFEGLGVTPTYDMIGSYSYQKLMSNQLSSAAYGYLYSQNAMGDDKAVMDFNREKDGVFTRNTPNLPLTNLTYDLYGISGQGVGGMFRSFRTDVGYVRDPLVKNTSASFNVGAEFSVGNLTKVGANGTINSVTSESGMWQGNNEASSLSFSGRPTNSIRETGYFKLVGEKNVNSSGSGGVYTDWWKSALKGDSPVRIPLTGEGTDIEAKNSFRKNDGSETTFGAIAKTERAKRSTLVSHLTVGELKDMAAAGRTDLLQAPAVAEDDHIGLIKVVKTDGSRYVYGLPAYNLFSKEVTFNVSGRAADCASGLVSYQDNDASKSNDRGKDNFFQSTKTPAYAHSYLLTSVLSADYSDYDDIPGPSVGDVGNFVKFTYESIPNYKWRVPFENHKASYDEGLKSVASDDMGNYVYGEKELKYLDKIESKTHVAIFHTSDRSDGKGVTGESGGLGTGTTSMKKLDKISLYTRAEYEEHESNLNNATPLKEVHFEYSYDLCPGVPNSTSGGKLTLTKLYFTYGKSYRAKMNAYEFIYADLDNDGIDNDGANPSYNLKGYDRWGSYHPNSGGCEYNQGLMRAEFPYTNQDKNLTDVYKSAWNLTDIKLPSGGVLEIEYESDDYAYVQDKKAMQMVEVVSVELDSLDFQTGTLNNKLYDGKTPYPYLIIKTPDLDSDDTNDSLRTKYFEGILGSEEYLHYRFLVNLSDKAEKYQHEYISSYCKVITAARLRAVGNGREYAYIQVEPVKTGDAINNSANAHPISVASWNFMRKRNPDLAYGVSPKNDRNQPSEVKVEDVFVELLNTFKNFGDYISGANGALRIKDYAQKCVLGKSWVRLNVANGRKLGGDVRVSQLLINDRWGDVTSLGSSEDYGQVYDYELPDGRSSGVAAYEPMIGGDENPFRQPVFFSEDRLLAPDDEHFLETPFGESFFPAPSVGYARVVVKNLQYANVTRHAQGKVIQEFYTARDFPTITTQTKLEPRHKPANFLSKMLKFSVKDYMHTSQGYVVEKNDMHGKPKASWVYAEGQDSYQSGVEYHYKTNGGKLSNTVPVLFKDNVIKEDLEIGVDYDLVNDFRHSQTLSKSGGLNANGDAFVLGILPIIIPIVIPSYSKSLNQYRSVVTTKVVNRFGIQTGMTVHSNNSVVETENLLWDSETGEVLLTQVNNHYDDPVYNLNLPAHLAYEGMSGAYQNEGYILDDVTLAFNSPFVDENDNEFKHFYEGDEVLLNFEDGTPAMLAWVISGVDNEVEGYYLIDKEGNAVPGTNTIGGNPHSIQAGLEGKVVNIKVIRSGRRNMAASMGTLTLKDNPIIDGATQKTLVIGDKSTPAEAVMQASATEFSDQWHAHFVPRIDDFIPVVNETTTCEIDPVAASEVKAALTALLKKLAQEGHLTNSESNISESTLLTMIGSTHLTNLINHMKVGYSDYLGDVQNNSGSPQGPLNVSGNPLKLRVYYGQYTNAYNPDPRYDHIRVRLYRGNWVESSSAGSEDIVALWPDRGTYFGSPHGVSTGCTGGPIQDITSVSFSEIQSNNLSSSEFDLRIRGADYFPVQKHVGHYLYAWGGNVMDGKGFYGGGHVLPFDISTCTTLSEDVTGPTNPYVSGNKGAWRPARSWIPAPRERFNSDGWLRDGAIMAYLEPFWGLKDGDNIWSSNSSDWVRTNTVTKYDQSGNVVEEEDAIGNYSMALYGYSASLPTAVCHNARWGQVAYLGFEDYLYAGVEPGDGPEDHYFYLAGTSSANISDAFAHSGRYSMMVPENTAGTGGQVIYSDTDSDFNKLINGCLGDDKPYMYVSTPCDAINKFLQFKSSLPAGSDHQFLISYWVRADVENAEGYEDLDLTFEQTDVSNTTVVSELWAHRHEVVDGWQKVDKLVEISLDINSNREFKIILHNSHSSNKAYFDDLRIYPADASMKSFVYDPQTLRLSAQLDENNYATFYEYDEEGILVRVKKESERGVLTLTENRNNLSKN